MTKLHRLLLALGVLLALVLALLAGPIAALTPVQPARPYWIDRACPDEASVNCFWDAEQRGDGQGHSYVVRQVPNSNGLVCVFYTEQPYAKDHDYCYR